MKRRKDHTFFKAFMDDVRFENLVEIIKDFLLETKFGVIILIQV